MILRGTSRLPLVVAVKAGLGIGPLDGDDPGTGAVVVRILALDVWMGMVRLQN